MDNTNALRFGLSKALNTEPAPGERLALNVELPAGEVPEWVELLPAGEVLVGRDGRTWRNPNPQAVVDQFNLRGMDLVIDWEHATEHRAPKGEDAPAAAWVKEMEVRDGSVWGRTEWTPKAAQQLEAKAYRYLSPVFLFTRDERQIVRLTSAGLTNQPNLALTALNQQTHQEDFPVWKDLLKKLGLPEDATEAQAITALNQVQADLETAKNREANPSLDKYVPRADFDQAQQRAANAEQQLEGLKKQREDEAIETAINQALEDRKIAPATVEYHKAQCRTEGGLERFKAFVESAPVVAGDSGLDGRKVPGADKALNAETLQIASMMGNSEEDLKTYGGIN
ncbi:phage protease [Marinobacter subterrani]|uniref:Mu-like prophage I protein n=1 Tax=Marinobacter subterrani TaxID=1658765 RepID=A0A0J7LYP0_9GAMM|nr:phage protease [Marinobacter subterrani]KMQ74010.1 Mu-like prophage I protein [Marinobacter subterrani]